MIRTIAKAVSTALVAAIIGLSVFAIYTNPLQCLLTAIGYGVGIAAAALLIWSWRRR